VNVLLKRELADRVFHTGELGVQRLGQRCDASAASGWQRIGVMARGAQNRLARLCGGSQPLAL